MELFESEHTNCGPYRISDASEETKYAYFSFQQDLWRDKKRFKSDKEWKEWTKRNQRVGCTINLSQTCGNVKVYISD